MCPSFGGHSTSALHSASRRSPCLSPFFYLRASSQLCPLLFWFPAALGKRALLWRRGFLQTLGVPAVWVLAGPPLGGGKCPAGSQADPAELNTKKQPKSSWVGIFSDLQFEMNLKKPSKATFSNDFCPIFKKKYALFAFVGSPAALSWQEKSCWLARFPGGP